MRKRGLCRHAVSVCVCVCVCVSVTFADHVKTNKDIFGIFSLSGSHTILVFRAKRHSNIATGTPPPNGGVECKWGRQKLRFRAYLALVPAVSAATYQVLSTGSPVDHGHRLASYYTSLVVSGGVHCGRRRRNVYDKKPRRYAKDNRTAHLTARCDKSLKLLPPDVRF